MRAVEKLTSRDELVHEFFFPDTLHELLCLLRKPVKVSAVADRSGQVIGHTGVKGAPVRDLLAISSKSNARESSPKSMSVSSMT